MDPTTNFRMPDLSLYARPRFQDLPQDLIGPVLGLIDLSFPACRCRRQFLLDWKDRGLDLAYANWKRRFDDPTESPDVIRNPRFLAALDEKLAAVRSYGMSD